MTLRQAQPHSLGGSLVNDRRTDGYLHCSVADREPAAKSHLVTVLASAAQPATTGLDRSGCQRRSNCSAGPPGRPGELGQGRLGRHTTTRTPRCPGVEYHTCFGADSGAAGPASSFSSQSLKMCPSDHSAARAQRYGSTRESPGTQIDRDQRACGPMVTSSAPWYQRVP